MAGLIKPLRLMFSRDFTDIKSGESFHTEYNGTYFPTLAVRMSACRNTVVPISSSLCVLKRCKLLLFILVFFFFAITHLLPQGKK